MKNRESRRKKGHGNENYFIPALNVTPSPAPLPTHAPADLRTAKAWAERLRQYSPYELESLLSVSPERAVRAKLEYDAFGQREGAAVTSFRGLVYTALSAATLTPEDLAWADSRLLIFSALYGVLRPLDAISPYRLELNGKFRPEGIPLAEHWGGRFAESVMGECVLNLASEEYAAPLRKNALPGTRITEVRALAPHRGKYRSVVAWTKQLRGALARYAIRVARGKPVRPDRLCRLWLSLCARALLARTAGLDQGNLRLTYAAYFEWRTSFFRLRKELRLQARSAAEKSLCRS